MKKILLTEGTSRLYGPFSKTVYAVNKTSSAFEAQRMQYLEPIYKSLLIPPSQENADDARRLLILPVQHTKTLLYALLDATLVFNGEKAAQQSTFLVQKEVLISQYSLNELARICAQISAIWNTKAEIVVEQVKDDNFLFTFTPH